MLQRQCLTMTMLCSLPHSIGLRSSLCIFPCQALGRHLDSAPPNKPRIPPGCCYHLAHGTMSMHLVTVAGSARHSTPAFCNSRPVHEWQSRPPPPEFAQLLLLPNFHCLQGPPAFVDRCKSICSTTPPFAACCAPQVS